MTALRIAAFGGVFQLCFLPLIRRGRLVQTLKAWRLRGNALLVAVASLTLLENLHYRLNQVIHARIARGMANEGVLNRVT